MIRYSSGGGTGVALRVADWYQMHKGELVQVLPLRIEGHSCQMDCAHRFTSRFLAYERTSRHELLRFAFAARFETGGDRSRVLWREQRIAVYSRSVGTAVFRFDPRKSTVSPDYRDKVFNYDTLSREDFIRFGLPWLMKIARTPRDIRRPWLKRFVAERKDTPEVRALRAALDAGK